MKEKEILGKRIIFNLCRLFYLLIPHLHIRHSLVYGLRVKGRKGVQIEMDDSTVVRLHVQNDGKDNNIQLNGTSMRASNKITIRGNGNRVVMEKGCVMSHIEIAIAGNGCEVRIGHNGTSNGTLFHCAGNGLFIHVGNDCMFASYTEIWASDGHVIYNQDHEPVNQEKSSVTIGNHVWMGEHAKILKGVSVADGCALGMCCLQTQSTEPESLYAGIPGRKLRSKIHWER